MSRALLKSLNRLGEIQGQFLLERTKDDPVEEVCDASVRPELLSTADWYVGTSSRHIFGEVKVAGRFIDVVEWTKDGTQLVIYEAKPVLNHKAIGQIEVYRELWLNWVGKALVNYFTYPPEYNRKPPGIWVCGRKFEVPWRVPDIAIICRETPSDLREIVQKLGGSIWKVGRGKEGDPGYKSPQLKPKPKELLSLSAQMQVFTITPSGEVIFKVGKHKGERLDSVMTVDEPYCRWFVEQDIGDMDWWILDSALAGEPEKTILLRLLGRKAFQEIRSENHHTSDK